MIFRSASLLFFAPIVLQQVSLPGAEMVNKRGVEPASIGVFHSAQDHHHSRPVYLYQVQADEYFR